MAFKIRLMAKKVICLVSNFDQGRLQRELTFAGLERLP